MNTLVDIVFSGTGADLGAEWTPGPLLGSWQRVSDTAQPTDLISDNIEFINNVRPGRNQWAECPVTIDNSSGDNAFNGAGPAICMSETDTSWYGAVAKNDRVIMLEATAGSFAQLGTTFSTTWIDGDRLTIWKYRGLLSVFVQDVLQIGPTADSSQDTGRVGLIYGSTVTSISVPSFKAGNFDPIWDYSRFPFCKLQPHVRTGRL